MCMQCPWRSEGGIRDLRIGVMAIGCIVDTEVQILSQISRTQESCSLLLLFFKSLF